MIKTDRQLHFSGVQANTRSFAQSGPVSRRAPTPPWLWLKVLVGVCVGIPVVVRLATLAIRHFS